MRPLCCAALKEQVAADLPEKTEQVLSVELSSSHRRAYDVRSGSGSASGSMPEEVTPLRHASAP